MNHIIIFLNDDRYQEFLLEDGIYLNDNLQVVDERQATLSFHVQKDKIYFEQLDMELENNKNYAYQKHNFFVMPKIVRAFSIKGLHKFQVGINKTDNLILLEKQPESIFYLGSNVPVFQNGKLTNKETIKWQEGDWFLVGHIKIIMDKDYIELIGDEILYETALIPYDAGKFQFDGFPYYKRSPRIMKMNTKESVSVLNPPAKASRDKKTLAKIIIPPVLTMSATLLITIIQPRGIYIIVSVIGTVVSIVFSIITFFEDKNETIQKNKTRNEVYTDYLLKLRKSLFMKKKEQVEATCYNNPSLKEIEKMVRNYSSRIFERSMFDEDFLNVMVGKADVPPSFQVQANFSALELEKDELMIEAEDICNQYKVIENMPITAELLKSHLGIVGEKTNIHELLKSIFVQLTFAHSYTDVEMVFLYDQAYKKKFDWLKWYSHFKLRAINVTGLVCDDRIRDQVLEYVMQELKERKLKKESKKVRYSPHFVIVIDEPDMIEGHSIMEYIQSKEDLGFSIIYTNKNQANLPETIKTILLLEDSETGRIVLNNGLACDLQIGLEHTKGIQLEEISRNLSSIIFMQEAGNYIPDSITFFDMYKVQHPQQLDVINRWNKNTAFKTLAVPLGVRGVDDYVYLNLHEKAHGPHGLVAGTTGSGKSEIVQSYILSLAVNFHPYEVGFLLIDYKGGGMAGLFKDLPHLLGTITNLDGAESMRAMASIKSELARRQQIFNQHNVNHIDQYSKLFKSGKADNPLPHLFIISDEFAELKKEQPEFMKELVSTARVGRSLGIHLILATQKPSGVVDDQIWTNSKFKLALKVANPQDSNEILKTPDAANITQPGRAYLQVGNNEIYELFQSAWSGAVYSEGKTVQAQDNRVYYINELGQGQLLNKDLSKIDSGVNEVKETQLDVIVKYIRSIYDQMNLPDVERPWLPSLSDKISSPYITLDQIIDVNTIKELDLTAPIGLVDIPEKQQQMEYKVDFNSDGNIAIFGASGFGKTFFLSLLMTTMAIKNSPQNLHYFVLDLGNSGLIQMKKLPHTADYIGFDDQIKLQKMFALLLDEMKTRKRLFAKTNAMNFAMYNQIAEETIPAIFLFIDNYDVMKEINLETEEIITKITRDGASLGLFTVVAGSRVNVMRFSILNNFKLKLPLYMYDRSDVVNVAGRPSYDLGEIKGRSLIKIENLNHMQLYTSVDYNTIFEYTENVDQIMSILNQTYTGEKVKGIPMLPDTLDLNGMKEYKQKQTGKTLIPIGLDTDNVEVEYMDLNSGVQLIMGGSLTGKTNLLKIILEQIPEEARVYIFDSPRMELFSYHIRENIVYLDSQETVQSMFEEIQAETEKRTQAYSQEKQKDPYLSPKAFYTKLDPVILIMEDCDSFIESLNKYKDLKPESLLMDAVRANITIIGTSSNNKLRGYDSFTKFLKESIAGVVLGNPNDQSVYTIPHSRATKFPVEFGYLCKQSDSTRIKIPLIS